MPTIPSMTRLEILVTFRSTVQIKGEVFYKKYKRFYYQDGGSNTQLSSFFSPPPKKESCLFDDSVTEGSFTQSGWWYSSIENSEPHLLLKRRRKATGLDRTVVDGRPLIKRTRVFNLRSVNTLMMIDCRHWLSQLDSISRFSHGFKYSAGQDAGTSGK